MRRLARHVGSRAAYGALICLVMAASLLASPPASLAKTKHNSTLIHVGPSGLTSYNAWTKKSTVLVHGMPGTWFYPVISPHGISVVTAITFRSDRAYYGNLWASLISPAAKPFELTIPDEYDDVGVPSFLGWLDDYRAVFQQQDPADPENGDYLTIVRDTREPGSWSHYSGAVTYPAAARKTTAADKKYSIKVSHAQYMTIRSRKTKKRIAHFKVHGSGNGKSETGWYFSDASISPDGKFVAYELWRTPYRDARVSWRTYVCTVTGKHARLLKNGNGGFVWK